MKRWLTISVIFLCLVLTGLTACNPLGTGTPPTTPQLVKVVRGDLAVTVKGNGKIQAPNDVKLTFGSAGRIDKIFVKEGDTVAKDMVLARLDTGALELARSQGQVALNQAQVAVTQAKLAQQTAQFDLDTTRDKKDTLDLALLNAQIATRTAQYNLDKAKDVYRWPEVDKAQSDVDDAKSYLEYATERYSQASGSALAVWADVVARSQANLDAKELKLKAQLLGYDTEEVAIKKMQLDSAQKSEAQAQKNLDKFAQELALKEQQLESAQESIDQAQQNVDLAQQSLSEAEKTLQKASITAPFNGTVATVDADEGDTISPSNKILHLVDPTNLEMRVEVDEIDIPDVRLDQETDLTFDALPGVTLKGKVATILPVPIETGGVVLFYVKVSFTVPPNVNVKVGMSAAAEIVTNRRSNVLLVPNRAITEDSQGKPFVRVQVNDQVQERPVVVGVNDGVQTEILSGLNEGETVVVGVRPSAT